MTSGGDAQGMNPAVRAVVRTALNHGAEIFAIYEGYQGLIEGGDRIRSVELGRRQQHPEPRRHRDRHRALAGVPGARRAGARRCTTCVERGIDRLVVIGGDGSLSGADLLRAGVAVTGRRAASPTARSTRTPPTGIRR